MADRTPDSPTVSLGRSLALRCDARGRPVPLVLTLTHTLRRLAPLPHVHAVVVGLVRGPANLFTQCLVDVDRGAWVEAVADEFLVPGSPALTEDQEMLLAAYGYAPPGVCPNHWQAFDLPVDWRRVAEVMALPLVSVDGGTPADRVRLRVFPT